MEKVVAHVKMKPSIFYLGYQKPLMSRRSMQGAEMCSHFDILRTQMKCISPNAISIAQDRTKITKTTLKLLHQIELKNV